MEELMCTCGQSQAVYYPDENQWEPECWECYAQEAGWTKSYPSQDAVHIHSEPTIGFVDEDELPF